MISNGVVIEAKIIGHLTHVKLCSHVSILLCLGIVLHLDILGVELGESYLRVQIAELNFLRHSLRLLLSSCSRTQAGDKSRSASTGNSAQSGHNRRKHLL